MASETPRQISTSRSRRPAPSAEKLAGLTYSTEGKPLESDRRWRRNDLLASVGLAVVVGSLWWYFS